MISHRIAEVRGHADRLTILRSGHSVATGAPTDFDDDALIAQMLGRRVERLYPERAPARERVVLRARGLHVPDGFGPQDFELREGELLGIGGLEGQGQRALMTALAGAVPFHGELELNGKPISYRTPRHAIRHGIVFVPEDRGAEGLLLSHSIRGNIALSSVERLRSRMRAIDGGAERAATEREARAVGLDVRRMGEPARNLSGGNQQKVVLARAFLTEPSVLLLYDCTRGIDVGSKADIMAALARLTARGVAVVYYSSDAAELVHLCDRVLVVRRRRIAGTLECGPSTGEEDILHLAVGTRGDRRKEAA
jgi:ABC-type sugar transport system ATPase subunit